MNCTLGATHDNTTEEHDCRYEDHPDPCHGVRHTAYAGGRKRGRLWWRGWCVLGTEGAQQVGEGGGGRCLGRGTQRNRRSTGDDDGERRPHGRAEQVGEGRASRSRDVVKNDERGASARRGRTTEGRRARTKEHLRASGEYGSRGQGHPNHGSEAGGRLLRSPSNPRKSVEASNEGEHKSE